MVKFEPIYLKKFIDIDLSEKIKTYVYNTPWYFSQNISGSLLKDTLGFYNIYYLKDVADKLNLENDLFIEILEKISIKTDIVDPKNLLRLRKRMTFPSLNIYDKIDQPHIDIMGVDHINIIYYVNDSSGNTVIFNESSDEKNIDDIKTSKDLSVYKEFEPTQGSVLIFDGANYHSSSAPLENYRTILNYNLSYE